jgi:NAD(P)H dehydrogenase (quinone)
MKILIITAHPSPNGFTHKIAESFKKGSLEAGHYVDIIDLYREEYRQEYLKFTEVKSPDFDPKREVMQKKIKEADQLVFIHPMWWITMPAIMKNFIDSNFSVGFAYRYVKAPIIKGRPIGLLKGKTARVFMTCDGPGWAYRLLLSPHKLIWKYFILRFCGIKTKSFVLFDRMRWRSEEEREKWLEKVYRMGRSIKN